MQQLRHHRFSVTARRLTLGALTLSFVFGSGVGLPIAASALSLKPTPSATESVIVTAAPGEAAEVASQLRQRGAHVTGTLPIINGIAVNIRTGEGDEILGLAGVRTVSPDKVLQRLDAASFGPDETAKKAGTRDQDDQGTESRDTESRDTDTSRDAGSVESIARVTGARSLWGQGITGKGVDVALIDTGVAPLEGAPVTISGADLSSDAANTNIRFNDGYGHGTHMAGIIAGRDSSVTNPRQAKGRFVGIAPDARIVNVKVGAMDGSVHTSQVVAALDWVVQNRQQNGLNIKVVNLSYGSPATTDWQRDPLAWAAEVAWRRGVMVVAAAGNDGPGRELGSPAYSPVVLAVGATEVETERNGRNDYVVSAFTSTGTRRRPDMYVPGAHVASLRVQGSFIDTFLAKAIVNQQLSRGTGTSQATAVASGLAALLFEAYPTATPDQIKALLVGTVRGAATKRDPLTGIETNVDVRDAWKAGKKGLPVVAATDPFADCASQWCRGIGDGSQTLRDWAQSSWSGAAWTGSQWTGAQWTGASWTGSQWTGNQWTGAAWTGSQWTGSQWTGSQWTGSQWTGSQWTGASWTGSQWTGNQWTGAAWTGSQWTGNQWTGASWTGASWTGSAWSSTWGQ
jgi:serine protease AprX